MAATVLGISGSPVPQSNTDRAIREILEQSGLDHEFFKLSSMHLEPCRACQGCTEDNSCKVYDNGRVLAEQFARAKAFVLGGYTSYGSLDSRTKMFMERMYCLRHLRSRNRGKLGVTVLTTSDEPDAESSAALAQKQLDLWMEAEGIIPLGAIVIRGKTPCLRCGHEQCLSARRTPGTMPLSESALEQVPLEPTIMTRAAELGIKLRDAVANVEVEATA